MGMERIQFSTYRTTGAITALCTVNLVFHGHHLHVMVIGILNLDNLNYSHNFLSPLKGRLQMMQRIPLI